MLARNSIKPLELVVSAIHCLKEKDGSSAQNILRYLGGKYNVNIEILKPHVQRGLKRGLGFGIIAQKSGLYRLNDILSKPMGLSFTKPKKLPQFKVYKRSKTIKRRKIRHFVGRKGKRKFFQPTASSKQKYKNRLKRIRNRRRKTVITPRRFRIEVKSRKQKRSKAKWSRLKPKIQKLKKTVNCAAIQMTNKEGADNQNFENKKEGESSKIFEKTLSQLM